MTGAARPAVPTAGEPTAVATARGAVWVLEGASGIVESVDASAGRVRGRPVRVDAGSHAITTDGRWLWVASPRRRLLRIDPGTRALKAFAVPAGGDLIALAAGGGAVWWIDKARGLVSRVDAATGEVRPPVRVGPDRAAPPSPAGRSGSRRRRGTRWRGSGSDPGQWPCSCAAAGAPWRTSTRPAILAICWWHACWSSQPCQLPPSNRSPVAEPGDMRCLR